MNLHHIAMIISSEECLEFYKSLGFSEAFRKERENDTIVLMEGNGTELEVFIDPMHVARPIPEPLGLRHFALTVDGRLEDEINRLKGIQTTPILEDWKGTRFVFIKDPDGNDVELRKHE